MRWMLAKNSRKRSTPRSRATSPNGWRSILETDDTIRPILEFFSLLLNADPAARAAAHGTAS